MKTLELPDKCRCGFHARLQLAKQDEYLEEQQQPYRETYSFVERRSSDHQTKNCCQRLYERIRKPSSPMAHLPQKSKPKLASFFGINIFIGALAALSCVLVYKDNQNAELGLEEWRTLKFHKEYFEVGAYPMAGMLTSLAGACLDAMTIFVFLFGLGCSCVYYRHYTRITLISLLVTVTATVVLFTTEQRAVDYLGRYFKIVMEFEYKNLNEEEYIPNRSGQMFIDTIQSYMECCGFNGPDDWKTSTWLMPGLRELMLPQSCCRDKTVKPCSVIYTIHETGCAELLFKYAGRWRTVAKYCLMLKVVALVASILLGTQLYKEHVQELERRMLLADRRKLIAKKLSESNNQQQQRQVDNVIVVSDGRDVLSPRQHSLIDKIPLRYHHYHHSHKVANINNVEVASSGTI